ncbi:hypothetical protein B0H11DRAFT_1197233 [Mycena galericulata]|nr:hypothetical protein B0H11DRAFT_1197233 [Mycena galericulata]
MTILLIGGTGKSATPLVKLLHAANVPFLVANRSGDVPVPYRGVRFDWFDSATYALPFDADSAIDRVYLIAPPVLDMFPLMKVFIDLARTRGVTRFVLMSAAICPPEEGGPIMGAVHAYLASLGDAVEYCALRPSWFFDNILLYYSDYIRESNEIVNAAGTGRLGFISTEDIADVAFKALTAPTIEHSGPIMVGPELLSYAEVAQILSDVLGRKITHRSVSADEFTDIMVHRRMPANYAAFMAAADVRIAEGAEEEAFNNADFKGTRTLRAFLEKHKDAEQFRPKEV